jgi:hypothetical protein
LRSSDFISRRFWKLLALFTAIIALVILIIWSTMPRPTPPRLSVTYLATINGNGHWRLKFGVTNIGNRTIVTDKLGSIEVIGHSNKFQVGATAPLVRLAPGEGHIVEAVLSEEKMASLEGPWRYTCLYANDNFRTWLNKWQWSATGPGARINWLIPRRLKGIPLTVTGTSDWVNESK